MKIRDAEALDVPRGPVLGDYASSGPLQHVHVLVALVAPGGKL